MVFVNSGTRDCLLTEIKNKNCHREVSIDEDFY